MATRTSLKSVSHRTVFDWQSPRAYLVQLALILVALGAGACSPGFDDITDIKDLRVIGVQASPPQLLINLTPDQLISAVTEFRPPTVVDQAVDFSVTMLIVDPREGADQVKVTLEACVLGGDKRCRDDLPSVQIADKWVPLGESTFVGTLTPELINAAMEYDAIKGVFGAAIWLNGEVTDGVTTEAFLKTFIVMPDYTGQQEQNTNPTFDVLMGDEDAEVPLELNADGMLDVKAGEKVRLLPVIPEDQHQKFVVFTFTQDQENPTGNIEEKTEEMTLRYFASCGSLSTDFKSEQVVIFWEKGDPDEDKDLSVEWSAPKEPQECIIWMLLEDGRGGTNWLELPVSVI